MLSHMADILSNDCPNTDGSGTCMVAVNTLTGEAECECGETWIYGATELLEILNNLET